MHLLRVEDDNKMLNLLKRGLEEENHRVTVAQDGISAQEIAEDCYFDVLILDVMLPKLDGFELARRLRRRRIQTPILMLTAKDAVPDIATGLDAGADDYLTKPFAFAELLARVRALARRGPANPTNLLGFCANDHNEKTAYIYFTERWADEIARRDPLRGRYVIVFFSAENKLTRIFSNVAANCSNVPA